MILEKLHLDKESRQERKLRNRVAFEADVVAEKLINSKNPNATWQFSISKSPEHVSVEEFASKVGHAAVERINHYTCLEIASFNERETSFANITAVGIGIDKLDTIPPPEARVQVVFDRTATGKAYKF